MAGLVLEDGFVDLDLLAAGDSCVVWFETRCVNIVVIALDGAVGVERAGFEYFVAGVIADGEMQPRAAGWISSRKFVSGQVFDEDVDIYI